MNNEYRQYIIEKYKGYKELLIADLFLYFVTIIIIYTGSTAVFPHYILYIMTTVVFGIVMKDHIKILLKYRKEYKKVR